jgi:hypothetical protein
MNAGIAVAGVASRYDPDGGHFDLWFGTNSLNIPVHYSPVWGIAIRDSNFLQHLRFSGNIRMSPPSRVIDSNIVSDRRYDTGADNVAELLIQLFPSNASDLSETLEVSWNSSNNLGHFILNGLQSNKDQTLLQMASLLIKSEIFRLSLSGQNPFASQLIALLKSSPAHGFLPKLNAIPKSYQSSDDFRQNLKYLLNFRMGMRGMSSLLVEALRSELLYQYPPYTVDHSLLAFTCEILNCKDDIQIFLRKWSELRTQFFSEDYLNDKQNIFDTDSMMSLGRTMSSDLEQMTRGIPYTNPIGSGFAGKWATTSEGAAIQVIGKFSDCVEESIRHTLNYTVLSSGVNTFQKNPIRARVIAKYPLQNQRRRFDRLDALEEFYNTIFNPNDGSFSARTQWNKVTFGLNSTNDMSSPYPILYGIDSTVPNSGNELRSNFVNFVKAVGGILGIKSITVMSGVSNLSSLVNRLEEFLSIINPDNVYSMALERCDTGQSLAAENLQAFVRINVASGPHNFEFLLNSYVGHGSVKLDSHPIEFRQRRELPTELGNFADYFFQDFAGQSPFGAVFSFAGWNDLDYNLTHAVSVYNNSSNQFIKSAMMQSIMNIGRKMPITDKAEARNIFKEIVMACKFNNETYEIVKDLIPATRYFQANLKRVALHLNLSEAEKFDMTHNNGYTEKLALSGAINDIVTGNRLPHTLHTIALETLWNIDRLNLRHFSNLRELFIVCNNHGPITLPQTRMPIDVRIRKLQ